MSGWLAGESVIDSRYVRFMVLLTGKKNDDEPDYHIPIDFHKCTEAELKDFAPAEPDS